MSRGTWGRSQGTAGEYNEWPITGKEEYLKAKYNDFTSVRPKHFPYIEAFEKSEFVAVKRGELKELVRNYNDLCRKCKELRKKQKNERSKEQQLEELASEGIRRVEAAAKAKRHKAAKRYLEEAETYYNRMKNAEIIHKDRLVPLREPFEKLVGALACFAGCREETDYPDLAVSMENYQRQIRTGLRQWEDSLAALMDVSVPDYPVFRPSVTEEPANSSEVPSREDFHSVWKQYDQGIIAFADAVKRLNQMIADIPVQETETGGLKTSPEELNRRAKDYLREGENTAKYLNKWDWAHVQLLCALMPILKKIAVAEEETTAAQWADTAREIKSAAEEFRCSGLDVHYLWVFPGDRLYQESEKIRLTFVAGEARWPGLFCNEGGGFTAETLKCVINGRVLGAGIH